MKKLFFCLLLCVNVVSVCCGQDWETFNKEGKKAYEVGDYEKAQLFLEKAKIQAEKEFGKEHINYASSCNNLASLYVKQGKYIDAEILYVEAKNIKKKILGKNHSEYASSCHNLALLYYYQNKYTEAQFLYIEAIDIRAKTLGKEHVDYIFSCQNLADLYNEQGNFIDAEPLYTEIRNIKYKKLGKNHPDYATSCNNLASCYYSQGKYSEAESLYIETKNIRESNFGKNNIDYAFSCNNLSALYNLQGKYLEAEALILEGKNIVEKLLGKSHPDYSIFCNNLAELYNTQEKYIKAEILYLESKNIKEKTSGKNNIDYIIFCNNLALLYSKQGKYIKAELLYLEAKNIYENYFDKYHPNYALICNNLVTLFSSQGKYKEAEDLIVEAKDIYEKILGKNHPDYAMSCYNLASIYNYQGKYKKAESLYIEAKNIRGKVLEKNHPDYANSCNGLANLYVKQGNYIEANILYEEAKNIREKKFGKDHTDYANSCDNLASLCKEQGKYVEAESLFLQAKNIYKKILGKNHPNYAKSCNNLMVLYHYQGNYLEAQALITEVKNIYVKMLGKSHPSYAVYCNNLASLYKEKGKYNKAKKNYMKAKNIHNKILGKNNSNYANYCNNIASLYEKKGKHKKATIFYTEGNQSFLSQIDNNFSHLSEKEKKYFLDFFNYNFEIFNSFVLKRYKENNAISGEAYNNVLVTKELLFSSSNAVRERIMNSDNEEVKTLYNTWKDKCSYIANVVRRTIAEREKEGINLPTLETEANELEKQLSLKSEDFKRANDKTRYTWQDVQKELKEGEVAVELIRFQVFDKKWTDTVKYMALIVLPTAQKQPLMVALHNGNWLEKEGAELYRKHYQSTESVGKEDTLYQKLWQPIAQVLPAGTKKVYLSADGVYHQINLETLYNPTTQGYLGDNLTIQVVGSTKDILKRLPAKGLPTSLVLFGFPDYQTQTQEGESEANNEVLGDVVQKDIQKVFSEKITRLEGTKKEVEDIARLAQSYNLKTEVYLQKQASEGAVKKLRSPSVLHIATHGFYASPEKLEGVERKTPRIMTRELAMAQDENRAFDVPVENPLLRAGLLLAGAEKTLYQDSLGQGSWQKEDGILTAQEALSLYLDDTDLVVLSACETGLGYISNGEGVYGLQRSFQQAGAKAVIMSLWKVSDEVTQKLMTAFYTNWLQKKMPKREAFRDAQKQIRKEHPLPFYWGAFVMVGE